MLKNIIKPKSADFLMLGILTISSVTLSGLYMIPFMDPVSKNVYGLGWFGGMQLVISGTMFMLMSVYTPIAFLLCAYVLIKFAAFVSNIVIRTLLLISLTSALYFSIINFFV